VTSGNDESDMPPPRRQQQLPWVPDGQSWETAARLIAEHRRAFKALQATDLVVSPPVFAEPDLFPGAAISPSAPPPVGLLLKAVVIPGERTSEGTIIQAIALPWLEIIEYLSKDWKVAYQLPPEKWEEIIAGAYKKAGFEEVTLTPRSGDRGRDVIAVKEAIGKIRVIDQVKAYKPSLLVKANDVRAMIGVLQTDGAAKGFVTTTSDFAPRIKSDPTITPYIPSRLELINGQTLLGRLLEIANLSCKK
jgi:restriction system protein